RRLAVRRTRRLPCRARPRAREHSGCARRDRRRASRALIERHMGVPRPSGEDVHAYYETYAETSVRRIQSKTRAPWLGGRASGFALESNAPPQLFSLPVGRWVTIRTMLGPYQVKALDPAVPLGAVPFSLARPAVVAALEELGRGR